jgi:hypothetical protein
VFDLNVLHFASNRQDAKKKLSLGVLAVHILFGNEYSRQSRRRQSFVGKIKRALVCNQLLTNARPDICEAKFILLPHGDPTCES